MLNILNDPALEAVNGGYMLPKPKDKKGSSERIILTAGTERDPSFPNL